MDIKKVCFVLAVILFASLKAYSLNGNMFLGLSTEMKLSGLSGSLEVEHIDEMIALEILKNPHVRFRFGAGYFPDNPFSLLTGLEIPLVEKLSRYNTRMFGVYLIQDVRFNTGSDREAVFEPSLSVLFPLSMIGGISLGIGMDTGSEAFIKMSYFSGGYLKTAQKK